LNPTLRRSPVLVVLVAAAALLAACGSSSKSGGGSVTLNGSGSTFQKPFDDAVIAAFHDASPDITVNYAGGGSGQGKSDLQSKTVEWAGTDSLPAAEDLPSYQGGKILFFPTVAAPITVSYNLSGVSNLRLSGKTLAKIFALKITKWNDPAVAADNPGVTLPSTTITVAHRADGSGTTSNFTKFLDAVDPTDWTLGSGDTVDWASSTQAGTGNPGVAQIVQQTSGAVGYVDLADASNSHLTFASIENKSGQFVKPTLAGAAAAVAGSTIKDDLTYDPINAAGAAAYPITSPTWIMVYQKQTDKAAGTALKQFLQFVFTSGESMAEANNYAKLPDSVISKAKAQLSQLQIPSS
jgi:phosphate transport system substrate-binding protein